MIKFYCVDVFARDQFKIWIKEKLGNKFIIKYDKKNPDYLLFNKGKKHLNPLYNNAIKIAFYTENIIPDFNESDYLIAHPHINYLDRYFKYSMFLLGNFSTLINLREKILNNHKRNKFCAAVISHPKTIDGFRIEFINELNKYKKVDMGGLFRNNIGGRVKDKIKFLSQYKFSIAMENSMADGYITEKIPHSFIAGTIPIYYGDYVFDEYINPKSIIFIKGFKDIKKKIDYIIRIDNNDELYKKISKEKILVDNKYAYKIEKEFEYFLQNIFAQDKLKAYRINK